VSEPSTQYLIGVVLVSAAVTWTLRAAPFAVLAPLRRSALLPYLSVKMPVGVMTILVIYTLFSNAESSPTAFPWIPLGAAALLTMGLHLWRANFVMSVLAGTSVYVVLASTAFS
jgi:branched-subunit amino acid transport protein AzlD